MDPEHVSEERKRKIMGYEKLVMESICFDYQQPHPYSYVVKFVKWIEAMQTPPLVDGKRLAQEAYKLAVNRYVSITSHISRFIESLLSAIRSHYALNTLLILLLLVASTWHPC